MKIEKKSSKSYKKYWIPDERDCIRIYTLIFFTVLLIAVLQDWLTAMVLLCFYMYVLYKE
mgnify:CR=1 FL=1